RRTIAVYNAAVECARDTAEVEGADVMATTQFPVSSATTTDWLSPAEMRTLEAVCEALLPPTPPPAGESDSDGYYARSATDLGVATLIAEALSQQSPETRAQFKQLLGLMGRPLFGTLLLG